MNRIVSVFFLLMISLFSYLNASVETIALTSEEKQYIKSHKPIKYVYDIDWKPFEYQSDARKHLGLTKKIIDLISSKSGLKFEPIHTSSWSEAVHMVEKGKAQMYSAVPYNDKRAKYLNFTKKNIIEYFATFVKHRSDPTLYLSKSLSDSLKNKTIAYVKNNSLALQVMKSFPNLNYMEVLDTTEGFKAVESKNADLFIINSITADYLINRTYKDLEIAVKLRDQKFELKIALLKRYDKRVLDIINTTLNTITTEEFEMLYKQSLGIVEDDDLVLTHEEQKWLETNIVKVGITPWEPLKIIDFDNKSAKGVELDRLKLLADKLGMKFEYHYGTWSDMLTMFKNKELDLLPSTYHAKDRESFGLYSNPYMNIKEYLFVKDNSKIKGFYDLENKKIAIVKGYDTITKIKKQFPSIGIIETENLNESIGLVLNGKVDALYDLQVRVQYFIKNNTILGLKAIAQNTFEASPIHLFSNISKPILQKILQKGLDNISREETGNILDKWLGNRIVKPESYFDKLEISEQKYLLRNKVIKMCTNPNWEPIEFFNNDTNQPEGITLDIMKLIKKKLDNKISFEYIPTNSWSQSQQFLKEKKCDILPAAIKTINREKYANFTQPYLKYKLAIITQNDKPFVSSIEQIVDKPLARKKATGLVYKLKEQYPNINIIETVDHEESLNKVANAEVYYTIVTLPIASNYIKKFAVQNIHVAGYTDMTYNLSIAVRDDMNILLSILDKTLKQVSQDEIQTIQNKLTGVQLKETTDYSFFWKIVLVTIVLLLIVLFWNYKLKSLISIRTHELEIKTQELEIKTQEVKNLNKNLDEKVKEEIEKNRQQEAILIEQSKMVALGEMIGNIAHQWRQPLSMITTSASGALVEKEMEILTDEKLVYYLDNINTVSQHLSKTIDDFRDFLKYDNKKVLFNLSEEIEKCLRIEETIIKQNNIQVIKSLDSNITLKNLSHGLSQSMINIINNAKDAMLKEINNDNDRLLFISSKIKDNAVVITLKDNGGGIPQDIISRIFEPYFTTKHQSQGTGLGLHMTYKIITDNMGGKIVAENVTYIYKENQYSGAQFVIYLPVL
ncbi:MAG: transporter substrate-binding domain-containing protein [Campylobacterota bacterium]|nr:transporter substrate-binding domain-containing protein [Campylobacterota bacterium]